MPLPISNKFAPPSHTELARANRHGAESSPSDLRRIAPELTLPPLASQALDERLARASRIWKLSPRMAETLLLLVTGLSNKEIAACRDRSEVTIEYHVSGLLRRAGVDTRSRLVARFWLGLDEGE